MLLIAGIPPIPFSEKLVVTLLMLAVMGVVMGLVGRKRPRGRSIVLAVATALAIVTALAVVFPGSNYFGVLGGIVGALSAAYFLRVGNRELSSRRLDFLARIAFVAAPLIGLLLGLLSAFQAYPEDRAAYLGLGIGLGFFAGLIASGVLAIAAMLSTPRPARSKKQDNAGQEGKPNP